MGTYNLSQEQIDLIRVGLVERSMSCGTQINNAQSKRARAAEDYWTVQYKKAQHLYYHLLDMKESVRIPIGFTDLVAAIRHDESVATKEGFKGVAERARSILDQLESYRGNCRASILIEFADENGGYNG